MGQNNQLQNKLGLKHHIHFHSLILAPDNPLIGVKSIKIVHESKTEEILIENSTTCGWLLSEVVKVFPEIPHIVALRSSERSDFTDSWLLFPEKSAKILKDGATLIPVIGEKISEEMSLEWFTFISLIGRGGYSEVFLVRKKDDGCLYALKAMKKAHILKEKKVNQAISECFILNSMLHPFIISLKWAFQTVT